jgi:hypothetical protein
MRWCAAAVAVLLINDRILKNAFPGVITGKLSDFAGLFALGVLAGSLVPSRAGRICAAIGIAFIAWKTPLADPLIALWNAHSPFQIARAKDWTDLIALVVLPFAARVRIAPRRMREHAFATLLSAVAVVAFAATSVARYRLTVPKEMPLHELRIKTSREVIIRRLQECKPFRIDVTSDEFVVLSTEMSVDGKRRDVGVNVQTSESPAGTTLFVDEIEIRRETNRPRDEKRLLDDVQNELVSCLKPLGLGFVPPVTAPVDQPFVRFESAGPKRLATIVVLRRNGDYVEHHGRVIQQPDHSLVLSPDDPHVVAFGQWWLVHHEIAVLRRRISRSPSLGGPEPLCSAEEPRYTIENRSLISAGRFEPMTIALPESDVKPVCTK